MTEQKTETDYAERVRAALDESLTPSLPLAEWACDPLPSCPQYAHVNPDWLRALIAEARRVREVVYSPACPGCGRGNGLCEDCTEDGVFGHDVRYSPATPEQIVTEQERVTGLSRHQIAALHENSTPPGETR